MKFGRCIESYVVTVYAVNDTGKIYNALRKFGTLEFVRCMGENVVNVVSSNEVRLYVFSLKKFISAILVPDDRKTLIWHSDFNFSRGGGGGGGIFHSHPSQCPPTKRPHPHRFSQQSEPIGFPLGGFRSPSSSSRDA